MPQPDHERKAEGPLQDFLGRSAFETRKLFDQGRFPNVVVSMEGTVLALWGGVKLRRSEDGGATWGPEISIRKGFMGGGAIVNENNGEILAFVEEGHPPAPLTLMRSRDDGKSWSAMEHKIYPDRNGHIPSMHMNEAGITLRYGTHAGRLLRAARHYAGRNHREQWPHHYTTAIYSDDGGKTWHCSQPFADMGTGEAAIAELANGRLYYNSRAHWFHRQDQPPLKRRSAWSHDGGRTWQDWQIVQSLPDGPQDSTYGCMGGLVRLPIRNRDILLYSNCDSQQGRKLGTIWVSFDGGKTWPLKRLVQKGPFAYSSMNAGRRHTPSQGWIFLHFEGKGSQIARLNLRWLLQGTATGDGVIPKEICNIE
ncbi:MAG: exo-alpha-sialidase [Planctomycetota bacterium]|nr:MAG: exo-alpha-sialidase [Planctomycetota bacterium]